MVSGDGPVIAPRLYAVDVYTPTAYHCAVIFMETPIFTRDVTELLGDAEYAAFQAFLADNPDAGDIIQATGGLRKVRWAAKGRGKSGGVRIIYFHRSSAQQIRLLMIYQKGIKDDLSPREKAILRKVNEAW